MVAGANAGIKQNGNEASTSTPKAPVSIVSLVNRIAMAEVANISSSPKVFHAITHLCRVFPFMN